MLNNSTAPQYIYLGDRSTHEALKNMRCVAVLRPDGKCIRGNNGNMLVSFGERKVVVLARLLRKIKSDHP